MARSHEEVEVGFLWERGFGSKLRVGGKISLNS